MGSSFTSFRGQGFWSREGPLETWLCLVVLQLRHRSCVDVKAFSDLRETWMDAATAGCQGFVGNAAALDRLLEDEELLKTAIEASEDTLQALRKLGPTLDRRYLNLLGGAGGYVRDPEAWRILQVGEHFLRLLRGELTWDVRTSPMLPTEDPKPRNQTS
jgi:hypothetical protein